MDYLTGQRKHVLGILENLPEEAMRRPVLPTGWTCAGLVQHEVPAAAVLDLYRREIELADKIITDTSLEAAPAWWPDFFSPSFHLENLRQVLLHVIAETACHAGHLDAARELIDGRTWLILT
jgi:hypothetical protein